MNKSLVSLGGALALGVGSILGCGGGEEVALGQLTLPLSAELDDRTYTLANAVFEVRGGDETTLVEPDDGSAQVSLPLAPGEYEVELVEGWALAQLLDGEWVEVPARLVSANPAPVIIEPDATSEATFVFEAGVASVALGEGGLLIDIEVSLAEGESLVISEIMKNPDAVADAEGEWLEVTNVGLSGVPLDGCSLRRGTTEISLDGLFVEPLAAVVVANSEAAGFVADLVDSRLGLPNTSVIDVALVCGERVVDSVSLDPALLANEAGHAWSLSGDRLDAQANDAVANWCDATETFGVDYGTPGALNPPCQDGP